MALTDTHCHLDFEKFDVDRPEVLQRAWDAGLTRILIPGIDRASSLAAVKLAESHPNLFAALGVHPTEAQTWETETKDALRALARPHPSAGKKGLGGERKIVAIGEIGLDYYWDAAPRAVQQRVLKEQLNLAGELGLPVVLHLREAGDAPDGECAWDLLKILEEWVNRLQRSQNPLAERPGVLHSFSGNLATATKALQFNFYIGITGPVTYKNAESKRQLVKALPLDKILIETDAPYLAPVPQRGRRNEPAFVRHIADKIAEIHSKSTEEIAALTTANAARLFAW
ncbi:MAG: TatD family hydrolase [Anaerolineales bacterium]